jgi:hypothetical protein
LRIQRLCRGQSNHIYFHERVSCREFTAEQWNQMTTEEQKDWLDEKAFSSALEWAVDNLGYGWSKLNQEGINS